MSVIDKLGYPGMTLYGPDGEEMRFNRKPGHKLEHVKKLRDLPFKHVLVEVFCACGEKAQIVARDMSIRDCRRDHDGPTPLITGTCFVYGKIEPLPGDVRQVFFSPALKWRNHFDTSNPWEAGR